MTRERRQTVTEYDGPRCPRCSQKLLSDSIRSGIVQCPDCSRTFEATAFTPPARQVRVAEIATAGPNAGNLCANHARNVATTNCSRCGLFICALCDMNTGSGSYCPACFDRMRSEEKTGGGRRRAYASLARVTAVAGLLFTFMMIGPLFGILSMYYNHKARRDRVTAGEVPAWTAGMIIVEILAICVLVGSSLLDAFLIYSLFQKTGPK